MTRSCWPTSPSWRAVSPPPFAAAAARARYQAFAWGPLITVGVAELTFELATGREYWLWPLAVLLAVIVDFIVTALGLVGGFMIIKRERDIAIADVREAMGVSTLDPLTGIANRRGVAQQFADAAIGRPRGLAVIDCDHFKRFNDNLGHDVGDEVLVAVAEALQGEAVYIGRLGGEESSRSSTARTGRSWPNRPASAWAGSCIGARRSSPSASPPAPEWPA